MQMKKMWHNFRHNRLYKKVIYKSYCLLYPAKAIYIFILFEANMFILQEKYGKKYEPEEEKFRMKVFMENKYKILQHNAAFEKGQHSFKLGMNQYGDMVNE